jgi:3-dehydroquinate synthase
VTAIDTVAVALGERSYDIAIGDGLIAAAGQRLLPLLRQKRVVVVTDENVARHHLTPLLDGLKAAGIEAPQIVLPPGEATKDFAHFGRLVSGILDLRIERRTTIVALGGGVIGDLAGFAAATLLRGLDFVQIPTTLLAQVDSAVGGKTGIDTRQGKNLVGAFHQPRAVLADIGALDTLPPRELRAGYAEIVKYGLLGDRGFFEWLERHGAALLAGDRAARRHAVATSCRAKAATVAADERESGARALLNLGHTFGHALEAATGFGDRLLHGEAVAIGMAMAFDFSAALGLCPPADARQARAHLAATGLPTDAAELGITVPPDAFLAHMRSDKKVQDGRIALVLVRGIGEAFLTADIPPERLRAFLAAGR